MQITDPATTSITAFILALFFTGNVAAREVSESYVHSIYLFRHTEQAAEKTATEACRSDRALRASEFESASFSSPAF